MKKNNKKQKSKNPGYNKDDFNAAGGQGGQHPAAIAAYENLDLVPCIVRARGWRLYTENRKRLIDLYQEGGAAIMGAKPNALVRELKSVAARGLFSPFPNRYYRQFLQLLKDMFPGKTAHVYTDNFSLRRALCSAGINTSIFQIKNWRPYDNNKDLDKEDMIIPVLPFIFAPKVLLTSEGFAKRFPHSDRISPFILAGTIKALEEFRAKPERGNVKYPLITEAVSKAPQWNLYGNIYLCHTSSVTNSSWKAIFKGFLESGFLLPPGRTGPAILPGELSAGEEKKLAELLSCSLKEFSKTYADVTS